MTEANAAGTAKGPGIVLQPEEGESYWQPVWANGYSTVKISPKNGTLNLAMGIQVIAPGGYVREHSHTPNQEILFCFEGKGTVLVDGVPHHFVPGTTVYAGSGVRHKIINDGPGELSTTASGTERGGRSFTRGHIYHLLSNPIYIGEIAHKGQLYPGQHPAPIDAETWTAVRDQLVTNATNHRRKADAAEPSLLAGLLTDARGERFTPSHAVKKGRRYRYYVSTALITEAGTDQSQGWRLPAQEIEDAVIRVLADALTSPALLIERFGTAIPSDQTRKMLDRANRLAAALNRSPAERAKVARDLIEKVIVDQQAITIRMLRSSLSGGAVVPPSSANPSDSTIELTTTAQDVIPR